MGDASLGGLRKVVLARALEIVTAQPADPLVLLNRLAGDPAVTAYLLDLPEGGHLVGASPELLLRKRGPGIVAHPLAGSARRSADPAQDRAAADALAASGKDRHEHRFVAEMILDTLAPFCADLSAEPAHLTCTGSMWHLGTRIAGRLRDPAMPSALLAAALHPTPAVCGTPTEEARAAIAALEPDPRGFYAGAVGWCDRQGDGEWHVAIRCAEVSGTRVRAWAGAGIVAGSDPDAELAETEAKFAAILTALGECPARA